MKQQRYEVVCYLHMPNTHGGMTKKCIAFYGDTKALATRYMKNYVYRHAVAMAVNTAVYQDGKTIDFRVRKEPILTIDERFKCGISSIAKC